jgi:hypothetical protein
MSGLLAGKVWQSNLESHLKPLAAAMADIANDDGSKIYPSVAYLAWLLGKGERSVQQGLAELKTLGVIEAVAFMTGGRNHPTEYRLIETALPYRTPWKELRKGATSAPFEIVKGATSDTKGCNSEQQRVHFSAERVKPTAPDPSLDPSLDPSGEGKPAKPRRNSPRELPLPPDFPVTLQMRDWSRSKCPSVDVDFETEKFIDKARAKGWTALDWIATWRNWMRNAKTYAERDAQRYMLPEHPNAHRPGKSIT